MDAFTIKLIAIISMTLDHIKWFFPSLENEVTIYTGRIAFTLFAFLIGEGYRHTKNLPKYFLRLAIWGAISIIPFNYFMSHIENSSSMVNIYATLILGLLAITVFDKLGKKYYLSIPIIVLICYVGQLIKADYGWYGPALVFTFYLLKDKKVLLMLTVILLASLKMGLYKQGYFTLFRVSIVFFMTVIPVVITYFYNGTRGLKIKHLFYAYYPIHLIIFEILYRVLQ